MRTNLKHTMIAVAVAGLLGASSAGAADWAAYGTKGAAARTIRQDAQAVQGGLDAKRLASKGVTAEAPKGVSPSVARDQLCSKKDRMVNSCEFHCGA